MYDHLSIFKCFLGYNKSLKTDLTTILHTHSEIEETLSWDRVLQSNKIDNQFQQ